MATRSKKSCDSVKVNKGSEDSVKREIPFLISGLDNSANAQPEPQSSSFNLVTLWNPRSKESMLYLLRPDPSALFEIQKFNGGNRAWLIGNSVEKDGDLYMCSPIEPLFLLLTYFIKSDKYVLLSQIVDDKVCTQSHMLIELLKDDRLLLVADQKSADDLTVWKYNEEKTLAWLKGKVEKICSHIKEAKLQVSGAAVSSHFVQNEKSSDATEIQYMQYSCGILSEYLSPELSKRLILHLGLPEHEERSVKRKTDESNENEDLNNLEPERKKASVEVEPAEDYFTADTLVKKGAVKPNAKTKALAKSAVGSKSISSFFAKKT